MAGNAVLTLPAGGHTTDYLDPLLGRFRKEAVGCTPGLGSISGPETGAHEAQDVGPLVPRQTAPAMFGQDECLTLRHVGKASNLLWAPPGMRTVSSLVYAIGA